MSASVCIAQVNVLYDYEHSGMELGSPYRRLVGVDERELLVEQSVPGGERAVQLLAGDDSLGLRAEAADERSAERRRRRRRGGQEEEAHEEALGERVGRRAVLADRAVHARLRERGVICARERALSSEQPLALQYEYV